MVNEIPVNLFMFFLGIYALLFIYSLYAQRRNQGIEIDHIVTMALSTILAWLSANLILNGNVVLLQTDGTTYSYIPVQSLPLHYFLLAVAIVSGVLLIWFIFDYFKRRIETERTFSALGGDDF